MLSLSRKYSVATPPRHWRPGQRRLAPLHLGHANAEDDETKRRCGHLVGEVSSDAPGVREDGTSFGGAVVRSLLSQILTSFSLSLADCMFLFSYTDHVPHLAGASVVHKEEGLEYFVGIRTGNFSSGYYKFSISSMMAFHFNVCVYAAVPAFGEEESRTFEGVSVSVRPYEQTALSDADFLASAVLALSFRARCAPGGWRGREIIVARECASVFEILSSHIARRLIPLLSSFTCSTQSRQRRRRRRQSSRAGFASCTVPPFPTVAHSQCAGVRLGRCIPPPYPAHIILILHHSLHLHLLFSSLTLPSQFVRLDILSRCLNVCRYVDE